jgi:hypothetical protein
VASNVEIVRGMSEPFGGVDLGKIDWRSDEMRELLAGVYTEDVELRTLETGAGTGIEACYVGPEGVARYLEAWTEPFDEYFVEWLDFIEIGELVLVPTRNWGTGGASGARTEIELTWLYELRDGRVVRAYQYDTIEQAREAAAQLQQAP